MLTVRNRLAILMAEREIRTVSDLHRRIKEHGHTMSRRTLDKFYNNDSNRWDKETLATLCSILECDIGDLLILADIEEEKGG